MNISTKCVFPQLALALLLVPSFGAVSQTVSSAPISVAAATAPTVVPALVAYSGTALYVEGNPLSGEASITFLIFKDQTGGEPLFAETQTVPLDPTGHYKVNLGATLANGLPSDLFSTGDARWLEVQTAGLAPQPRVLLVSVPYAMKAADAATLGGLPASAFVLAGQEAKLAATAPAITSNAASDVTTTGGTAGYVPEFNGTTTIVDSPIFVLGGEVGIGTTTPTATLDVNGAAKISGVLTASGGETIGGPLTLPATAQATASGGFGSQLLKFYTSAYNSSTKAVVDPRFEWEAVESGNDTASPTATLELESSSGPASVAPTGFSFNLNGTINFASGQTFPGADITGAVNASSYDLGGTLFATGSASSGIAYLGFAGNTSSTGHADIGVGPGALASNTTGTGNVVSGFNAMYNNTTGSNNTASGFAALGSNTTGNDNTASGYFALFYNTTAGANTASGFEALFSNTEGYNNTASGFGALYSNTTGFYNTASGGSALYSNTTGVDNTASGTYALSANNTGQDNTASGSFALYSNTTGSDNAATGFEALYSNTIGNNNAASGDFGLSSNTTGIDNTASGDYALLSNTIGTSNTAVGYDALGSNQTGSDLTAVGYNAGDSSSAQVNNATALGANAKVGQNNSLVLGQTTAATPGASYVNVGIGTATPRSTLEVAVSAPNSLGPVLTLTNSGQGESAIDFNTGVPKADAAYAPAARILASGTGNTGQIVFQSRVNQGLGNNLVVDGSGVHVPGALDAAATGLRIDHPADPANKYLVLSSVQSSEMMNIFTGNVVTDELGLATVQLPDWFEAENTDFRYQLTVIGERFAQAIVSKEIANHQFTISTNASNVKISWQITAVRQDAFAMAHPLVVEQEKAADERGNYVHPELYGQTIDKQIGGHAHDQPASAVDKHFDMPPAPTVNHPRPHPPAPALNHPLPHPAAPEALAMKPIAEVRLP